MRKVLFCLAMFLCVAPALLAQDFRVYMSRSIMEIPDYKDATAIDKITDWTEVSDGGIYSNVLEVNQMITDMKSAGMKGLDEADRFRKLRDRTVLTFKIDDNSKYGTYNIVAKQGTVVKRLTTSRFFFLNVPMSETPVELTISLLGDDSDVMHLKCQSKPFGNDDIYLFQLDKVCQSKEEPFSMEVLMSDSTWETRPLKNQKFQCLFTTSERYPIQAYLATEGKKLELDISKWNSGVGLAAAFNLLSLKKTCNFTTHKAEFATFNWIGSGLFASYDTLYLQVRSQNAAIIRDAKLNIQRIGYDKQPVNDASVRYLGFNNKTNEYMVLTRGYPAYIEVQADGYLPLLYHYKGAADPNTHVLSKNGISDYVVMTPGVMNQNEPTFFKKELRFLAKKDFYLNVKKKIWDADVLSIDLVKMPVTETIYYSPNGATEELKMADGELREKYATLDLHYAVPKNSVISNAGIVELDMREINEKAYAQHLSDEVIDANVYTGLAHSFVTSKYDFSDCVPVGETAAITLRNGAVVDRNYPLVCNFSYTDEEIEEKGEEETTPPSENMEEENPKSKMDDALDLKIPVNFNFKISDKVKLSLACKLDYIKKEINWKLTLTVMQPDQEEGGIIDKASKRNNTVNDFKKFKIGDSDNKVGFTSDVVDSDKELNDIFGQNFLSGTGFKISFFASGKVPFTGWSKHAKTNFFDFVEDMGGTFGYGITYGLTSMGNLLRQKNMNAAATWADLIETFIRFGFKFDCYVGGGLGLTTFDDAYSDQASGRGLYVEMLAYAIVAAWLEAGLPANPALNFSAGIRGGAKLGVSGKFVHSFGADNEFGLGLKLTARALMQYYINIDTFLGGYHKSGNIFDIGGSWLFPEDNSNPYHKGFPFWIPKKSTRANSYKVLRAPEVLDYGNVVIEGVASDAAPRYVGENNIVINHLHNSAVYDDDGVDVVDITNGAVQKLSSDNFPAVRHSTDVAGSKKIIAYQQCDTNVSAESVTDENLDQRSMEVSKHFNICADMLQDDGTWKKYTVYESDEANLRPVAAIQNDGKAAVIWQSGTFDASTERTDSLLRQNMDGYLKYSRFDGEAWSTPVTIERIHEGRSVGDYQAIMRNDTVLVAVNITEEANTDTPKTVLNYINIPVDPSQMQSVKEYIESNSFSLRKVGEYNVIAITHQLDTCKSDVYVKTLRMCGLNSGVGATDVGLQDYSPIEARVIPAKEASGASDFALMWLENAAAGKTEDGTKQDFGGYRRVLNVARMGFDKDFRAATPITIGAEQDNLMILDYDGWLEDDRVKAAYTLSDPELAGGTVIVENEKQFSNSFNYDLAYDPRAVTDGVFIPLVLTVNNTGTSAINGVTLHMNNQSIEVEDAFVPPFQTRYFIVSYKIHDDFNGYISSNVRVTYENVLKAAYNAKRRASNLFSTQGKLLALNNVDTEMRLLSQHVDNEGNNTFVVEISNFSKMKFRDNQSVMLAIYDSPRLNSDNLVCQQVLIPTSEFTPFMDYQKLTATITVPNVRNQSAGVLVATIVDNSLGAEADKLVFDEKERGDNYQNVTLYATGTPTYIDGVRADLRADKQMNGKRISLTYKAEGIMVSGLNDGETVRLLNVDGVELRAVKAKGPEMFIPINRHSFFILNTTDESLKFLF